MLSIVILYEHSSLDFEIYVVPRERVPLEFRCTKDIEN